MTNATPQEIPEVLVRQKDEIGSVSRGEKNPRSYERVEVEWVTHNCGLRYYGLHHLPNRTQNAGITIFDGHMYEEVNTPYDEINHVTTRNGNITVWIRKKY